MPGAKINMTFSPGDVIFYFDASIFRTIEVKIEKIETPWVWVDPPTLHPIYIGSVTYAFQSILKL